MKYGDELIPERLNLVKSVADSEGPPLNIFQETLQQNKVLQHHLEEMCRSA